VNTAHPPTDDAEQQWITKYRNAIAAMAPIQQTQSVMIRKRVVCILKGVALKLHGTLDPWFHSTSVKFMRPLKLEVAPIKVLAVQGRAGETRKWGNNFLHKKAG
jgi:hypothetical protein